MTARDQRLSKRLAYVLRHDPASIGIELSPDGWIDLELLLRALNARGESVTAADITEMMAGATKQRFEFSGGRIRAAQGHSIHVDLGLVPVAPPELLYHGTVHRFLESIRRSGLIRGSRHHVHLSADRPTAIDVGGRRGKPIVLTVRAHDMHAAGHMFFRAANGVWLTSHVPPEYLDLEPE